MAERRVLTTRLFLEKRLVRTETNQENSLLSRPRLADEQQYRDWPGHLGCHPPAHPHWGIAP